MKPPLRLALGTAQFGQNYGVANSHGQVHDTEVAEIIALARQQGIDLLDTAVAYGSSEQVLGANDLSGFRIVSKLPPVPSGCLDIPAWIRQQVSASLDRLHCQKLYGLLLHAPWQLVGKEGKQIYDALSELRQDGMIEKVGISIYTPQELDQLTSSYRFDLVQSPLNPLDQRLLESGWLDRLQREDVEVHVRSIFLQGLLLMPMGQRPEKFNRWQDIWQQWQAYLAETDQTALQACLRFALSIEGIDRVIVGTDGLSHLRQILREASGELSRDLPEWPDVPVELVNPSCWASLTT